MTSARNTTNSDPAPAPAPATCHSAKISAHSRHRRHQCCCPIPDCALDLGPSDGRRQWERQQPGFRKLRRAPLQIKSGRRTASNPSSQQKVQLRCKWVHSLSPELCPFIRFCSGVSAQPCTQPAFPHVHCLFCCALQPCRGGQARRRNGRKAEVPCLLHEAGVSRGLVIRSSLPRGQVVGSQPAIDATRCAPLGVPDCTCHEILAWRGRVAPLAAISLTKRQDETNLARRRHDIDLDLDRGGER